MINEIRDIATETLSFTWPMIVISMVVLISLKVTDILIKKEKIVFYQELLKLFFVVYILLLFQVVTIKDVSGFGINFIPFKEIFRYDFGSYLFIKNIIGNLLLFLPFGFFVGYLLKIKKFNVILILSIITSLSIEITQLAIGRVFDIDDIILNVLGGMFGYLIYYLIDKFSSIIPQKLKKNFIMDIITILFIILAVRFILL